jgi:hypothetical protein
MYSVDSSEENSAARRVRYDQHSELQFSQEIADFAISIAKHENFPS